MTRSRLRLLKGDQRTIEVREWTPWLDEAAKLVERWDDEIGDDPFAYNETASVSLLASAAASAGHLGLAEYSVVKRRAADLRFAAGGRCDLWIGSGPRDWAFEFKQLSLKALPDARWRRERERANRSARCLRAAEADVRVGGLIVSLFWQDGDTARETGERLRRLAEDCDFAWEIRAGDAASDTFLFFDLIA